MRWTRALALASLLTLPSVLFGLGVGTLERHSGLNEGFDATIALLSNDPNELETLKINLASDEEFERAGVQRVPTLSSLQFKVVEIATGTRHVHVTSSAPIREPFLNFLIEVNWERGRIVREYTVLLDPPLYDPTRRLASHDARSEPPAQQPYTEPSLVVSRSVDTDGETYGGASGDAEPSIHGDDKTDTTPARIARRGRFIPGVDRPTERGDTLWSIAQVARSDSGVSMQQMMLAMLRANPEAFSQENVNTLKRGYVLRVPEHDDTAAFMQSDALEEIEQHHALWDEYRGTLAATTIPEPMGVLSVDVEPEVDTDVEPSDEELSDEARLKLVSPTDGVAAEDESITASEMEGVALDGLRRELALANERLVAIDSGNTDLRNQLTESEALVSDLSRMIELREAELAALQHLLAAESYEELVAEQPVTEEPGTLVEEPVMVEANDAEEVVVPPRAKRLVANVNATLRRVIPEPILGMVPGGALTILAILLLIIVGLGFMAVKMPRGGGGKSATVDAESVDPPSEDITDIARSVDIEEDVETELLREPAPTATSELSSTQTLGLGQVVISKIGDDDDSAKAQFMTHEPEEDPLAEVNVYLAYERFEQAGELLKTAIENEPDNHSVKLRLLEVFYSSNNKTSYEETARELSDAVGGEGDLWNSALAMWQEMSPDRALFEATDDVEEVPADASTANVLEIEISGGEAEEVAIHPGQTVEAPTMPTEMEVSVDTADDSIIELDAPATAVNVEAWADAADVSDLIVDDEDATEIFLDTVAASTDDLDSVLDDSLGVDLDDSANNADVSLDELSLELEDDAAAEERVADSVPELSLDPGEDPGLELISDDGEGESLEIQLDKGDDFGEFSLDLDTIELEQFDDSHHVETVKMELESSEEGLDEQPSVSSRTTGIEAQSDIDEVDTRLNLAKAYIELGDKQGAQTILDEVANEGTDAQQQEAAQLRSQLD